MLLGNPRLSAALVKTVLQRIQLLSGRPHSHNVLTSIDFNEPMAFSPLPLTRLAALTALAALPLAAHMISISTGELTLTGAKLHYTLRMPAYEVEKLANPFRDLLPQVTFPGATQQSGTCTPRPAENAVVCDSDWLYPSPPAAIHIRSALHRVTVANHVHLVSAVRGTVVDQAVLEVTSPEADIRFVPQSPAEAAYQQFAAGARRAAAGPPQILFLIALVLAARSRKELAILAASFALGQIAASSWAPTLAPQFVEAALAVSYLSIEILFLPTAQHRWAVVALLGALQGLTYAALIQASHWPAFYVLLGAMATALVLISLAGALWTNLPRQPLRPAATLVLAASLGWFLWRIAS
jgi:hypothetical protein